MWQELLERVDALRSKVDEAWRVLELDDVHHTIETLEARVSADGFWNDVESAQRASQELAEQQKIYAAWHELRTELLELDEFIRLSLEEQDASLLDGVPATLTELETRYQSMEFALLFSGAHDRSNAILSIHAGAGGTDAQDWAEMLLRMFVRYTERRGWKTKLLDESRGTEAGIKSATLMIRGSYAYGSLKSEAGVHRLVRQSPFNADALRQTSFALVEVLPELDDATEVDIKSDDLRIDTFMSGGKGGQSVNTTYSAVRIVHIPTGITVSCQNERSQTQNKETAMKILRAKLLQLREDELAQEKKAMKGEHQSAAWGNQIRSYVLHPYKMVKDHRTDVESSDPEAVLDGDLDMFIEAYLRNTL